MVPLNRALSKLGILSRAQATDAIRAGRVSVNGRVVRDPAAPVVPELAGITVDGLRRTATSWRTLLVHKPRGIVTTRRDPEGRRTIYDVVGEAALGLVPVGRLDMATSGLLILTSDTRLADWMTDPANAVSRVYVVTVRGRVTDDEAAALQSGEGAHPEADPERVGLLAGKGKGPHAGKGAGARPRGFQPHTAVRIRKASARETHLTVELRQGRNREVRRLFESIGHDVTRLKRVRFGGLELGKLQPGEWRELTKDEIAAALTPKMGRA